MHRRFVFDLFDGELVRRRRYVMTLVLVLIIVQFSTAASFGNVWQRRLYNYDIVSMDVCPAAPGAILAAGGDYYCCGLGSYVSRNMGFTWTYLIPGAQYPDWIGPVAFDPTNPQTFYVHSFRPNYPSGLFKTTDGGVSWQRVLDVEISALDVAPSDANRIYAMSDGYMHVSSNAGQTWDHWALPIPGSNWGTIAVHPSDPNILYIGVDTNYSSGTYKSSNSGQTWQPVQGIAKSDGILINPANPNIIYALALGLRRSADGGSTWSAITTPYEVNGLVVDWPRNVLYVSAGSHGVYKSVSGGTSWQEYSVGLLDQPYDYVNGLVIDTQARVLYAGAGWGLFSIPVDPRTNADFDGDGRADLSVFRKSDATWYRLNSSNGGFSASRFGLNSDTIAPGDFDGDGRTDLAVFRPSEGTWYLRQSAAGFRSIRFGAPTDIATPGDFDGDQKTDIAIFRPNDGTWWSLNSLDGSTTVFRFGTAEDLPVVGDYNSDGESDFAVYRPSSGTWYISYPDPDHWGNFLVRSVRFGLAGDRPTPADYDGDGKTDVAVYRPAEGNWYLNRSRDGYTVVRFGISTDIPVPGDYDGDGKADLAVYREGQWFIAQSTGGISINQFGLVGDTPIASAYLP